jgi:hypothetical protein
MGNSLRISPRARAVQIAPGIGSLVGRAVALAQADKAAAGFTSLKEIPASRVASYQPY